MTTRPLDVQRDVLELRQKHFSQIISDFFAAREADNAEPRHVTTFRLRAG